MMLLELVPLGSMLDYLIDHAKTISTTMEIPLWVSKLTLDSKLAKA